MDVPLVGYCRVGVERFVDFHVHVENLTSYRVASHHTPLWVP
jgi:hypothetical protein